MIELMDRLAAGSFLVAPVPGDLLVVDPGSGEVYRLTGVEATIARRLLAEVDVPESATAAPALDDRERMILRLLADGHSNEAIATILHFSVATIRRATTQLYRRLGARNRASAIARAHDLRLLV